MTPEEHDEALLRLESEQRAAEKAARITERQFRLHLGQRRRGLQWITADGQGATLPVDGSEPCRRHMEAVDRVFEARAAVAAHETGYTGWTRFRLVISSDGLVHTDARCRSFRDTTRTIVIPLLSGRPIESAVDLLGHACCSVCMPTAAGGSDRVSSSLVNTLVRRGSGAFQQALARQREITARRATTSTTVSHPADTVQP